MIYIAYWICDNMNFNNFAISTLQFLILTLQSIMGSGSKKLAQKFCKGLASLAARPLPNTKTKN